MKIAGRRGMRPVTPSIALLLSTSLAFATSTRARAPDTWRELDGLIDVRFENGRDLGPTRLGDAPSAGRDVALAHAFPHAGRQVRALRVGAGWIQPIAAGPGAEASLAGELTPPREQRLLPRLDVLAGPDVRLAGPVLFESGPGGTAVRWTSLALGDGTLGTAEVLIDPAGRVTLQYLRLPPSARRAVLDGRLRAGARADDPALGLLPQGASAFRLERRALTPLPIPLPPEAPQPAADGPPPAGCDPAAGTWCDAASGGAVQVFLNETFDDGLSAGRGWAGTGEWQEIDFAACPPGASLDPGRAWYYGDPAGCQYANRTNGDLTSPAFGPITANTIATFGFRLAPEGCFPFPCDTAEILVNGTPTWTLNDPGDPNAWFTVQPLDLSPWAGQVITLGFRFTTDNNRPDVGWFIDDVTAWDPTVGQPNCVLDASVGRGGVSSCTDRVSTQWSFNERDFCEGCSYTFYALVECGREMHLPLLDMEGADVRITDVLTGTPVSLRCRNQTSLADAGLGPYPVFLSGDCCPGGGVEEWWGPAFDETDNVGAGQVAWGFPDCPGILEYDANMDGGVDCGELPNCGGPLDLLTPGESQVMDCSIADAAGLCGIFRVDVISGGFVWDLFANCDGTNTPQFPIFHDCTEAWAAWNPLPELAVANLSVTDGCPNLDATFDIVNIGCADFDGDVTVRLVSDCVPADSQDHVISGPFPAGGTVGQTLAFTASCSPVRIEVFVDPDDVVAECTETVGAAACDAEAGVDSLATFSCGCTASLVADAGADFFSCDGEMVLLDGSASSIAPCAAPQYRWLDSGGAVLRDWDPDPTALVPFAACPVGTDYQLEVRCDPEPCIDTDSVRVDCIVPTADAGPDVFACVGQTALLTGAASNVVGCAQPEYRWRASNGAVIRDWAPDPELDLGPMDCALADDYTLDVRCSVGGPCFATDVVALDCVQVVADLIDDGQVHCEGEDFVLDGASLDLTTVNCTAVEYRWLDGVSGAVLVDWSPQPDLPLRFDACPAAAILALEARCAEAGRPACGSTDSILLECPKPADPVPASTDACGGPSADLACGVAEAGVSYWWDLDTAADGDGNGDPADDADLAGCDATASWPSAGTRTVRAWAEEPTGGCRSFADLLVETFDDPAAPSPAATPGCPGADVALSCGPDDPALSYSWDLDPGTDADGDGDPANDADVTGCDVAAPFAEGTWTVRVTATDARGCTAFADLGFTVDPSPAPPAVAGLGVGHAPDRMPDRLLLGWTALPDAATYRVLRGTLGTWYDDAAEGATGRGACDTAGAITHEDSDDLTDGSAWYYLVTAVNSCGVEGPAGSDSSGAARPARAATADCP